MRSDIKKILGLILFCCPPVFGISNTWIIVDSKDASAANQPADGIAFWSFDTRFDGSGDAGDESDRRRGLGGSVGGCAVDQFDGEREVIKTDQPFGNGIAALAIGPQEPTMNG